MSDLKFFPATKLEALAMLYVQSQDISALTPEQLLDTYNDAYDKIQKYSRDQRPHSNSNPVSY